MSMEGTPCKKIALVYILLPIILLSILIGYGLILCPNSKYIGGHSDVVTGVVIGSAMDIDRIFLQEYEFQVANR